MFLGLDATMLARIQFAFTVTFHIIFPAFTIGLASYTQRHAKAALIVTLFLSRP